MKISALLPIASYGFFDYLSDAIHNCKVMIPFRAYYNVWGVLNKNIYVFVGAVEPGRTESGE